MGRAEDLEAARRKFGFTTTSSQPAPSKKLPYALAYARHGMAVFPLHHIEADGFCSCGAKECGGKTNRSAGKHPRFPGWQTWATTDESRIREHWAEYPDDNVGVLCGPDSGLTVVDVDGPEGRETLRELELEHGELPETPVAITGSGGAHYYFRFTESLRNDRWAPGLDLKTAGGYVVGVGSRNFNGPYEWEAAFTLGDTLPPAPMPKWLRQCILAGENRGGATEAGTRLDTAAIIAGVPEGQRDEMLFKLACKLRNADVPKDMAVALVSEAAAKAQPAFDRKTALEKVDRVYAVYAPAIRNGGSTTGVSSNGAPVQLAPLPPPMRANEWFAQEEQRFAEATFIWDGVLEAGGYTMVGGKKGHGKSTFTRTLAFKLSRGEDFLGRAMTRSRVWYMDFEPGGRGRINALRRLGWVDDDWIEFSTIPPPVNHPDVFKWVRQNIIDKGFEVIVVDTLFKLLRIDGANDYDKGLYAQVPLEEICRELNVCIIVLHHARKNGMFSSQQSCAEQMLGATSLAGAASSCILISHKGDNYTFRMDAPRYGEAIEGEIVLTQDENGWVSDGGTWKKRWVNMTKASVMEAARARGDEWFMATDLQVGDPETGETLPRRSLFWALNALAKDNELEVRDAPKTSKKGRPPKEYRVMRLSTENPQKSKAFWENED